jgi:7-carboxy-7-deazaguanine synthase
MMALNNGVFNVCFTGGEPMLQSTDDLEELIEYLQATGLFMSLEMFSNGTIPYSDEIVRNCHIIMDWKLPGSGEQTASTTRAHNYKRMDECGGHTIKFTCKHEGDLRAALELHEAMCMDQWTGDIYVGPVWDSELPPRRIVEFVLEHKLPWNLNIQVHKYVWKPDARRT